MRETCEKTVGSIQKHNLCYPNVFEFLGKLFLLSAWIEILIRNIVSWNMRKHRNTDRKYNVFARMFHNLLKALGKKILINVRSVF